MADLELIDEQILKMQDETESQRPPGDTEELASAAESASYDPITAASEILKNIDLSGLGTLVKNMGEGGMGDMKVLDPEHPYMTKFQSNLREHLLKLHQETDVQLRELATAVQKQMSDNDQIGKHVSILQKELLNCKDNTANLHKTHSKIQERKQKVGKKTEEVRTTYNSIRGDLTQIRDEEVKLQKDMEDTALQVVQLREIQVESYQDASTMARAKDGTSKQKEALEIEKLRQDLLINRLEADQHSLQNKMNLCKAQYAIKQDELADLRKVLMDAVAYIQNVYHERLQLMQQWNYSILSLEKRDQTCAIMRDTIRAREDEMLTLKNDISNHKKLVRKELEENEKLTMRLMHVDSDIAQTERIVEDCQIRLRSLEEQYAFFDQLVAQADHELTMLKNECEAKSKEIDAKARSLEKAFENQRKLEAEHMKKLHDKITITKTSIATEQLIKQKILKIQELETKSVLKEGERATLGLKLADTDSHLQALDETLANYMKDYNSKSDTITKSEAEITKNHAMMEKKQKELAVINEKLSDLLEIAGGSDLGPLEREIANLKKEIVTSEKDRKVQEQEWLRYQKELVSLTNESSVRFRENEKFRRKEIILEEQKIRLDAELNHFDKEVRDIRHNSKKARNDIDHLNTLLHKEQGREDHLHQEAEMLKCDFLNLMKDAELSYIQKEDELDNLRRKRSNLLYKLVEAQQQTVLMEEKLQWVEETKKILRSASYTQELDGIRTEIKHYQFRLTQIKKEMEVIIQEMEKLAFKHATLYVRADSQCLKGTKKKSKHYLKTKTYRLQKMIKDEKKKMEVLKEELQSQNLTMLEFKNEEEHLKSELLNLSAKISQAERDTWNKMREKWQNVIRLSFKHKKSKLLQKLKDDKYVCLFHSDQQRADEVIKIHNNFSLLSELINDLMLVHPELQTELVKVTDHTSVGLQL